MARNILAALTLAATGHRCRRADRDHLVARHGRRARHQARGDRRRLQRQPGRVSRSRPVYKGNYTETMTAAIAAFRAGEQPDIVQVFEVGTGTMMAAEGAIYPVYQLMADTGEAFDPAAFLPAVVGYYTDTDGNMLSMPFNSSTPILYYNKDVFEEAGPRPRDAAGDLGAAGRVLAPDHGVGRRALRLHLRLDQLDPARELLGLAQPADRHQRERLRRRQFRADLQRRARRPGTGRTWRTGRKRACSATAARAAATTRRRRSMRRNARCT